MVVIVSQSGHIGHSDGESVWIKMKLLRPHSDLFKVKTSIFDVQALMIIDKEIEVAEKVADGYFTYKDARELQETLNDSFLRDTKELLSLVELHSCSLYKIKGVSNKKKNMYTP